MTLAPPAGVVAGDLARRGCSASTGAGGAWRQEPPGSPTSPVSRRECRTETDVGPGDTRRVADTADWGVRGFATIASTSRAVRTRGGPSTARRPTRSLTCTLAEAEPASRTARSLGPRVAVRRAGQAADWTPPRSPVTVATRLGHDPLPVGRRPALTLQHVRGRAVPRSGVPPGIDASRVERCTEPGDHLSNDLVGGQAPFGGIDLLGF